MIINGNAVITKDVDLFRYLLTAQQAGLKLVYLTGPLTVNAVSDILDRKSVV